MKSGEEEDKRNRPLFSSTIFTMAVLITTSCANAEFTHRKGVTLAGDVQSFIDNDFAKLQDVLDSGAGVIGVNLPWYAATQTCATCSAVEPTDPSDWNDGVYASSPAVEMLDLISSYVQENGNGAFVMAIVWGTPGWAACSADLAFDARLYPPQDAADFGEFMYAMSERYRGTHTSDDDVAIGKVRDWVIYNEVNAPDWWHNSACNTTGLDPVYYYGGIMNAAYDAIHHLPPSLDVRALAGAFTSYHHEDYLGTPGTRLTTSYADWESATDDLESDVQNHTWISPLDFITRMEELEIKFDAIAHHPYNNRIYDSPFLTPPSGAVTLANIGDLLAHLQTLYPSDTSKWHVALSEYHMQSYYGNTSLGFDHVPGVACPNYFCASTTEVNLESFLADAYSTTGSDRPYVDYLIWTMWDDVAPYTGGIVRSNGDDKNENLGSGSVRATYTAID
jgi:hypothetical protein